jgi:hypothetical protein
VTPPDDDDDWLDHLDPDAMPPDWVIIAGLVLAWVAMFALIGAAIWRLM